MAKIENAFDLISYLSGLDVEKMDEKNYLKFLNFDSGKQRKGMIETLGIESYAAIYIANQIRNINTDFGIILADGKRRKIPYIIKSKNCLPKAVFITAMSSNFPTAVAASIILNYGEIPVIIGGIHVSTSPNDMDIYVRKICPHPNLIAQVIGPGDSEVIKEIIKDLLSDKISADYYGKKSIENGVWGRQNIQTMTPMKLFLLERIPFIGKFLVNKIRINPITPYLGCPYSCNFCSISTLAKSQRKFTTRNAYDFINEIKHHQKDGVNSHNTFFFFLPDNLLLGGKRLNDILDKLIQSKTKINYAAQISIDVANNENLLKKMRLSGATHFFIGLESLNIRNLEYIGKHIVKDVRKSGLDVKQFYEKQIKIIQNFGISIHASFILGLPFDNFNSISDHTGIEIANFCIKNHIGLQPCSLTDLPGSKNFHESQTNKTFLYDEHGTLNYLISLCVADLTEPNRIPPASLYSSPLLVCFMAYQEIQMAASTSIAARNGFFMFLKAFFNPTNKGIYSIKERVLDALWAFASQISTSQYIDHGEMISYSKNGIKGTVERLFDIERNDRITNILRDFTNEFI